MARTHTFLIVRDERGCIPASEGGDTPGTSDGQMSVVGRTGTDAEPGSDLPLKAYVDPRQSDAGLGTEIATLAALRDAMSRKPTVEDRLTDSAAVSAVALDETTRSQADTAAIPGRGADDQPVAVRLDRDGSLSPSGDGIGPQ